MPAEAADSVNDPRAAPHGDLRPDPPTIGDGLGRAARMRGEEPTSTTVGVTRLAGPDFMIEIEAVAVVNS
jgi:enamine deaminase RidA (YjgF/YER057c/UK114 family)